MSKGNLSTLCLWKHLINLHLEVFGFVQVGNCNQIIEGVEKLILK